MQSVLNYDITLISVLKVRNVLPCLFKLLQVNSFSINKLVKNNQIFFTKTLELQEQNWLNAGHKTSKHSKYLVVYNRSIGLVRKQHRRLPEAHANGCL